MAITVLNDLEIIKNRIQNNKHQLLDGEICNFHALESYDFVQVVCDEIQLKKIINKILGKYGYNIKIYNIRYGFNRYPWYDTQIRVAKSFSDLKNVYDFSGFTDNP